MSRPWPVKGGRVAAGGSAGEDAFAWQCRQLSKLVQINSCSSAPDLLVHVVGRFRRGGSYAASSAVATVAVYREGLAYNFN